MSIFKSCDIRGVYGQELDEDTAYRLGRVVGQLLQEGSQGELAQIVVGGDYRPSTGALKGALIVGLLQSGAQVIDVGTVPTPVFYYARRHRDADGGIMITASHNPPGYNGFKIVLGDLPITERELQAIEHAMAGDRAAHVEEVEGIPSLQEALEETVGPGHRQIDVLADYRDSLIDAFPDLGPHHVVVDAGNGSMGPVAPDVLRRVGQRVEELYCRPDGTFPNRDPNPAQPKHLTDLCERVVEAGADLGVAYDGDGDRVIFVDETGQVLAADRVLVLFVRHMLADRPGAVVYDQKSSSAVAEETKKAGGRPLMERSGYAFIKRRLIEEGAILAGEVSGHYFFGELRRDDALYATLLMLAVLERLGQSLHEAIASVPDYPITPDIRLPCPPEETAAIIETLTQSFTHLPVSRMDGVRITFAHGWALARPSVTEPLITLRFQGETPEALREIQRAVRKASPRLDQLMEESGAS